MLSILIYFIVSQSRVEQKMSLGYYPSVIETDFEMPSSKSFEHEIAVTKVLSSIIMLCFVATVVMSLMRS